MKDLDTKMVTFTLMMGVLGNFLFAVSYYAGFLSPGIALDFSLIAVFVAGFYAGPYVGFIAGLFVGIFPGIMFGPMGLGSWLGLIGLPIGKGLTGLTAGIVSRSLNLGQRSYSSVLAIPSVLFSYVPECLFTFAYFAYLMPLILGSGGAFVFIYYVLPKALGEVTIIGFLMAAIVGNHGFNDFIRRYFTKPQIIPKFSTSKSD